MELYKCYSLTDGWEGRGYAGWGGTAKTIPFSTNPTDVCLKWTWQSLAYEAFNTEYPIIGMGFHYPLLLQSVTETGLFPPSIKLEKERKSFRNYAGK